MQIEELNITISERNLAKLIKKNPNFLDEANNFSRLKYENFCFQIIWMLQYLKKD